MKRKRLWMGIAAVLILPPLLLLLSVLLISESWLKDRLIEKVEDKLEATLTIEKLSLSPWSGEARLEKVILTRVTETTETIAEVPAVEAHLRVVPLFFRSVQIESIAVHKPRITYKLDRTKIETRGTRKEGISLLKKFVDRIHNQDKKPPKVQWNIHRLTMHDGTVVFENTRRNREPFRTNFTNVQYSATNVSMESLRHLLYGADITAKSELGRPALFEKKGTATPPSTSLTGIQLTQLDRYFDQEDALKLTGGTLDIRTRSAKGSETEFEITTSDFTIAQDPHSDKKRFFFVPVSGWQDYLAERNGALELRYTADTGWDNNADIGEMIASIWKGMWIAIVKQVDPDKARELFREAFGKEPVENE